MNRDFIAVNLGVAQMGTCSLCFHKSYTHKLNDMEIRGISESFIKEQTKERREESMTEVKQSTNRISGKISVSEDKILQLAVPYSRGWHIFVDGKRKNLSPVVLLIPGSFLKRGAYGRNALYQPVDHSRYGAECGGMDLDGTVFCRKKRRISVDKRIK